MTTTIDIGMLPGLHCTTPWLHLNSTVAVLEISEQSVPVAAYTGAALGKSIVWQITHVRHTSQPGDFSNRDVRPGSEKIRR